MKQYLIDTFKYNDLANKRLLEKINILPDKDKCIYLFSHLINSQLNWMARIKNGRDSQTVSWWAPVYKLEELETEWSKSVNSWIDYLERLSELQIQEPVSFTGLEGNIFEAKLQDIALQLNYHSIHHRAQMQTLIRQQGLIPDFLDYIGTVYKKLN